LSPTLALRLGVELAIPFFVALTVFALVVLLGDLYVYAELIVRSSVAFGEVGRLAALQLVPSLTTTLPFALLIGMLVGLGRLSADREILAFETVGISPLQTALPCLFFAAGITLVTVLMSTVLSPASQVLVREELIRLASAEPGIALYPGVATHLDGWRIEAHAVEDNGASLSQVLVFMPSLGDTIFARRGAIASKNAKSEEGTTQTLRLEDGMFLTNGQVRAAALHFETLETELPSLDPSQGLSVDDLKSRSVGSLFEGIRVSKDPLELRGIGIELNRRLALGVAAFPFALLAVGLSLGNRRASRSGGVALGLMGVAAYYALLQFSEGMLRDPDAPVVAVMWIPNAAVLLAAGLLMARAMRGAGRLDGGRGNRLRRQRRGDVHRLRLRRWALPRYVGRRFLGLSLLCLLALTLAYVIVDVSDNLKWFNKYDATLPEIGRFYAARLPVLGARTIPLALLIGCALTISLLGSNGELLGMRACGLPIFRILTPVWMLCLVAVPLDYLLTNELVPRANARASDVNRTEIKNGPATPREGPMDAWVRSGSQLQELQGLDLLRGRTGPVTLYDLDPKGLPERRVDASSARALGNGSWILEAPRSVTYRAGRLDREGSPERVAVISEHPRIAADTAELTPNQLRAVIAELEREGAPSLVYRADLQSRLAAPLACLLLPLIALFFSSTGPPFPRPVHAMVLSLGLAIFHAVITSLTASLGRSGFLGPALAGWSPPILFALMGLAMGIRLLRRMEGGG
jgi:LPS export ABC transporter permease LptG